MAPLGFWKFNADARYELPLAIDVTKGNVHDSKRATPLLAQAAYTWKNFHPRYVLADAAYSSEHIRHTIKKWYKAEPIIDPNPSHKKAVELTERTPEWKAIYNRRGSIERLFGRLKTHRKLDTVRVRGKFKVETHAKLAVIVCQAHALATGSRVVVQFEVDKFENAR